MMWRRGSRPTADPTPSAEALAQRGTAFGRNLPAFRIGFVGAVGVLLAVGIAATVGQLGTVFVYVGLALFLALGLDPLVSRLERVMPRGLAIAAVVLGVLGFVVGMLLAVIPVIVNQATNLIANFPNIADDVANSQAVAWVQQQLVGVFDIDDAIEQGAAFLQNPNNLIALGGGVAAVGVGVASGVTGFIIVSILTLYFLASLRGMKGVLYRFIPAYDRDAFAQITEEITGAVGRYVVGQLSLALCNGLLSLVFLTIIDAPVPVVLAFVAFFGSMIPLVGTLTASILITLACLIEAPQTALVAGIYYLVYMQIEAYVLSPRIMSRAVSVPGAMVVVAAVAGGVLGGVLGALVAIPVAASVIIIVQKIVFPLQDAKTTDPHERRSPAPAQAVAGDAAEDTAPASAKPIPQKAGRTTPSQHPREDTDT